MAELTFPGGQVVQIEFDEKAHSYVVAHKLTDGTFSDYRPTHGVTTPLIVVPKAFLQPWAAKEACYATLEWCANNQALAAEKIPELIVDLDNEMDKKARWAFTKKYPWLSKLKSAYRNKSKVGQDLGTWLHESIEIYYNTNRKSLPIVTPDCQGMWTSFKEFDNFFKPDAEECEFFVYSLLFGYSGQGDFRGQINGKYCIGDWKTTNRSEWNADGIDVEYFFQLGGLAQAEYERTGKWVDDVFIANFDKKGEEPRILFASDFGMSPQDCAKAYISCFNNYHTIKWWEEKFKIDRGFYGDSTRRLPCG
jgi:hypothetical protein